MGKMAAKRSIWICAIAICAIGIAIACGCGSAETADDTSSDAGFAVVEDAAIDGSPAQDSSADSDHGPSAVLPDIGITEDFRKGLDHGEKGKKYQKYIVLHDTEGEGEPSSIIEYWDGTDTYIAAHFVVGKDGSIWQCVPLDRIAHHAGYGDAGHNELYGVEEDGRDDMRGTTPIGDWAPDYGMNAWSIGIEMVHVNGAGDYPEKQLEAVDNLIAYIDAYYGGDGGKIIDHNDWRSGNSDTGSEFAEYMENYQDHRTHD